MNLTIDYVKLLYICLFEYGRPVWNYIPAWFARHYLLLIWYGKIDKKDIDTIEGYRILIDDNIIEETQSEIDIEHGGIDLESSNKTERAMSIEMEQDFDPNNWTNSTLDKLCKKYGHSKIRNIDTISRKVFHHTFLVLGFDIFYSYLGSDATFEYILALCLVIPSWIIWYFYVMKSSFPRKNLLFRLITFGAMPRIRDGYLAYKNIFIVKLVAPIAMIIVGIIIWSIYGDPQSNDDKIQNGFLLIVQLTSFGLLFGDAFGEIIGAPFGRHTFSVKGLGEINKKSIEGCIAVFMATLLPSWILILAKDDYNTQYWLYWTVFIASVLCVLTETFSFRSTDNFTIPVVMSLFYSIMFRIYHI